MAFPANIPQKTEKKSRFVQFLEAISLGNRLKTAFETVSRLLNRLELFVLSFVYLVFTGIAICLNRKIPKQWFRVLPKTRISKIFQDVKVEEIKKESVKSKVRVVDVETGKEISLK